LLGDANGIPGANTLGLSVRPDLVPGVPIRDPRWTRQKANDIPYFNQQAFARPAFGQLGDAPWTMDRARGPWRPNLNLSVFRSFYPFENRRRYLQLRGEFYNAPNHTWFAMNPNSSVRIFSTAPRFPPFPSVPPFPLGSREHLVAANYNPTFGVLHLNNNHAGRIIKLAIKVYW